MLSGGGELEIVLQYVEDRDKMDCADQLPSQVVLPGGGEFDFLAKIHTPPSIILNMLIIRVKKGNTYLT